MQVDLFQIFIVLAETASFSKAAEVAGITQSAVSQQIRALEKQHRVTLIERSKRNLTLTTEGRVFLEGSRDILHRYEELLRKLHHMRDTMAGSLRISTVFSIGLHELPPYLKEFRRLCPDVEVLVDYRRSAQIYTAVSEGEADIGLVAYPTRRKGLNMLPFWRDRLVLICAPSHRLAGKRRIRLKELSGEKFIAFDPDLPTRQKIDRRLREAGVEVSHTMEFDNIETLKRSVEIESGISIVPETTVQEEVTSRQLAAVEITPEMWRPLGAIVKRRSQESPMNHCFLDLLQKMELGGLLKPVQKRGQR